MKGAPARANAALPVLAAHGIAKRVQDGERRLSILSDVSFELGAGERVALLGASGSGKSTLLHIVGALDPDYEGSVSIAGERLEGMSDRQLAAFRGRTLGFVFQSYNLLSQLSALENVLLPAHFGAGTPQVDYAREVLESLGMADKTHRRPSELSGGERQRVAIARSLVQRPRLVLCDEPTGNLDETTAKQVLALFDRLGSEGVALLIVTHDVAVARTAQRVLRLTEGKLALVTP